MKLERRNLKRWIPILGSLLLAMTAFSAEVRMSIEPEVIGLLDRAVLKIEFINTKGKAIDMPEIEGLKIEYQRKNLERRTVNFKSMSKEVHSYLITPTQVGDFTIGPVIAKFKGGEKEVSAKLRVIKKGNDEGTQELSEIMFSRITSDREAPYVHEPFDLDVDIYIRDDIQIDGNFRLRGGIPESGMEGDLKWSVSRPDREERDGIVFKVYHLRTTAKTITAGTFEFCPEVQINVVIPRQNRRSYGFDDPFFGDMFGRQETRPFVLDCNTLKLDVQSVPVNGRPKSFTGGVGMFGFEVSIGPTQIKVGEPITIKTRIEGKGNLNQITPPLIEESHDYKLYDARTVASQNPNEVRFEQVLIPTTDAITHIPAISFSYFNTTTADFRTISKGPFPIEVEAMPQQVAQIIATVPGTVMQETQILGRDIIYLKPSPKHWKLTTDIAKYNTLLAKILLTLPTLLLLLVAGITARQSHLTENVALARRQKAPKAARRTIQRAEQALRKGDEAAFYEALWNTLVDYFGHRLNLAPGQITLQTVLSHLPEENETIESLFSTIEQRRYGLRSSESSHKEMKTTLKQLTATLRKCERMKF